MSDNSLLKYVVITHDDRVIDECGHEFEAFETLAEAQACYEKQKRLIDGWHLSYVGLYLLLDECHEEEIRHEENAGDNFTG